MRAVVVTVAECDVDVASDVLWSLGVRAIEERSADASIELWTAVGEDDGAIERAGARIGHRWVWRVVEVVDDAADTWREFASPMWVGDDLVVVPAWQDLDLRRDDRAITRIDIEPGGTFGLGDHPTTWLSLHATRRLVGGPISVLDVGCGTGVLGIAAALLGAASVRAVDVADAAVEATIANTERNHVVIDVDASPLGDIDGVYDLVVANILAPTLVELADDLRRVTAPSGRLVVSGILADRHDHVLQALAPMIVDRTDTHEGWAAVTLRHL